MEKLRYRALALIHGLLLAVLFLPLAACPVQAAAAGQSLREQRAELQGISRILELRSGQSPQTLEQSAPVHAYFDLVPLDHWAYPALQHLSDSGLVSGYPAGWFQGDKPMSRYEFAQAMSNLLPLTGADDEAQLAAAALRSEFSEGLLDMEAQMAQLNAQLEELQTRLNSVRESQE